MQNLCNQTLATQTLQLAIIGKGMIAPLDGKCKTTNIVNKATIKSGDSVDIHRVKRAPISEEIPKPQV